MNTIVITGNISRVELKESKGKKYARFYIQHHTRKTDGTYDNGYLDMVAFDKVAERLSKFKKGSPLEFIAHFSFSSYVKNGKVIRTVDCIVDNFNPVGNGAYISYMKNDKKAI